MARAERWPPKLVSLERAAPSMRLLSLSMSSRVGFRPAVLCITKRFEIGASHKYARSGVQARVP